MTVEEPVASALIDALAPTPEDALAVVCAVGPVVADVIRVVSVRGTRAPMLRVWRGTVPFVVRGQSERLLCSVPDKAFRAAIASSLTDDGFITAISGDSDTQVRLVYVAFWTVAKSLSQGQPYFVEATPSELQFLKAAEVVGARSSSAQARRARFQQYRDVTTFLLQLLSLVLVAGITNRNGDPSSCVDSLLAAAFGAPGRPLAAAQARERLNTMAQVVPLPDSLPEVDSSRGAEGPYALALAEHPHLAAQLEVTTQFFDLYGTAESSLTRIIAGLYTVGSKCRAARPTWSCGCRRDA